MTPSSIHQGKPSNAITGDPLIGNSPFTSNTAMLSRYGNLTFGKQKDSLLQSFATSLISLFAILLFIHTPMCLALPEPSMAEEQLITIEKQSQTFTQALESIADQVSIEIVFDGTQPTTKRDLFIRYADLDRAISQILRLYGVENAAMVYNAKNDRLVQVVIHGFKSMEGEKWTSSKKNNYLGDRSPLTLAQMDMLAAQSAQMQAEMDEELKPLTPEQIEQLREQSLKLEAEYQKSQQPLSREQKKQLETESQKQEMEYQNSQIPLTAEQMKQLERDSEEIKNGLDLEELPLTKEQLLLLKDEK